jgi:hypothetical protein
MAHFMTPAVSQNNPVRTVAEPLRPLGAASPVGHFCLHGAAIAAMLFFIRAEILSPFKSVNRQAA